MNSGKKRFCLSQSERMQLKRVVVQLANKIHVDRHYFVTNEDVDSCKDVISIAI